MQETVRLVEEGVPASELRNDHTTQVNGVRVGSRKTKEVVAAERDTAMTAVRATSGDLMPVEVKGEVEGEVAADAGMEQGAVPVAVGVAVVGVAVVEAIVVEEATAALAMETAMVLEQVDGGVAIVEVVGVAAAPGLAGQVVVAAVALGTVTRMAGVAVAVGAAVGAVAVAVAVARRASQCNTLLLGSVGDPAVRCEFR